MKPRRTNEDIDCSWCGGPIHRGERVLWVGTEPVCGNICRDDLKSWEPPRGQHTTRKTDRTRTEGKNR